MKTYFLLSFLETRAIRLKRTASVATLLIVAFGGSAQGEDAERHFTRKYRASAYVSLMSVTMFTRSDVGGGFAALEETNVKGDHNLHLSFLAGSTPERAHGLNRLGFIEENIHETNNMPDAIRYFGFITANRESSLKDAQAALDLKGSTSAAYIAAEGISRGSAVRYRVHNITMPASVRWANSTELLQQVAAKISSEAPLEIDSSKPSSNGQTTLTFLCALTRIIGSPAKQSSVRFIHNGKVYELQTERTSDGRAGRELQKLGLADSAESVIRLNARIRGQESNEETAFHLWFDSRSQNPLPLRFEFRPKSYLRLMFEAQPDLPADRRHLAIVYRAAQNIRSSFASR